MIGTARVVRVFGRAEPARFVVAGSSRPARFEGGRRKILAGSVSAALVLATAMPAAAHHVGAYVPKDNAVTTNFKQVKFSVQAKKFDVALQLFEAGALRAEMRAHAATLPLALEEGMRAALKASDGVEVERRLMVFFAALARDLAREADRHLADAAAEARAATGRKFLEAIWRYYNLVDFAVSVRDNKTSVAVRLAFDEAETYVKPTAAAASVDASRLRQPFQRIANVLSTLVEASSTQARRDS